MNTKYISVREKQAIGALCVLAFSENYNIKYKGLEELVNHMMNILKTENLTKWNEAGSSIEIVGRGDDLPSALESIIPNNLYKDFYNLIDNAVEIGVIDLFGKLTDAPDECLSICLEILKKHNINFNIPKILLDFNYANKSWGEPWNIDKYKKLQQQVS